MFAVTVMMRTARADFPAFLNHLRENAAASLRDEPGCRRFDICRDPDMPGTVFLYELYDDAEAFEAHKRTPHYRVFDDAVSPMLTEKTVRTYAIAEEARP